MPEENKSYEQHRASVIDTIRSLCVKVSKDGGTVSYNWSIAKVFGDCNKLIALNPSDKTPETFKRIIRFEFNKMREALLNDKDWTHRKTTQGYALTIDGVEARRSHLFANTNITLEEQLRGAGILMERTSKALQALHESDDFDTRNRLIKRQSRLLKEINFLRDTLETNKSAMAEATAIAADEKQQEVATVPA